MDEKKPRRKPLTLRILKAMQIALTHAEAGGPEDIGLYETDSGNAEIADDLRSFEHIGVALSWVNAEIARREKKRAK